VRVVAVLWGVPEPLGGPALGTPVFTPHEARPASALSGGLPVCPCPCCRRRGGAACQSSSGGCAGGLGGRGCGRASEERPPSSGAAAEA